MTSVLRILRNWDLTVKRELWLHIELFWYEFYKHMGENWCSFPSNFISLCFLSGFWCIHLHLLCTGNGGKDGGAWDLWPSLLPGRHVEQAGLLHRHGWVSNSINYNSGKVCMQCCLGKIGIGTCFSSILFSNQSIRDWISSLVLRIWVL